MIPVIKILHFEFSAYALLALLGTLVGIVVCLFHTPKAKREDMFYMACYAFIGALIGSKLLFLITQAEDIFLHYDILFSSIEIFTAYLVSGFVFYGGLIGGIIGSYLYCRQYKINWREMIPIAICFIPIFHCFGRIGCYLSGCCYGVESTSFLALPYYTPYNIHPDASRIPVQLFEAVGNLCIAAYLLYRLRHKQDTFFPYLLLYATVRFCLEFLRGDIGRGVWVLSTSQWISLAILVFCITYQYMKKRNVSV